MHHLAVFFIFSLLFTNFVTLVNCVDLSAVIGGKVSLPCYVNVKDCGEVYFVAWTKSEAMKEGPESWPRIYMYSESINKPLGELVNRATFSVDRTNGGSLTIDNVKPTDEGYYRCDVTYISVGKCPSLTYVRLQVLRKYQVDRSHHSSRSAVILLHQHLIELV